MKNLRLLILFVWIFGCSFQANEQVHRDVPALPARKTKLSEEETSKLKKADIKFQFIGNCDAYSSMKNAIPSNGEYQSSNFAQKTDSTFPEQGIYLTINENEFVQIGKNILGCKLYLVNSSDSALKLTAQDSRLDIVAEAQDKEGSWLPISYLPSSWCGNSYHKVVLDSNEFWEFNIPVFTGPLKTKIRYKLITKSGAIYSNEIESFINKEQLDPEKKQKYGSTNLMDPYSH